MFTFSQTTQTLVPLQFIFTDLILPTPGILASKDLQGPCCLASLQTTKDGE